MAGRAKELIAADVHKLITILSGFSEKEDPENFELCKKFAFSNLLHHGYLSVDSNAVRRSVFGMVTKFMIHGHLEASRRLDCLLNKYLNCNFFKDKEVQWAMLSLLVKLADNPTSHIKDDKFTAMKEEEKPHTSEPFDWTTYSHLCDYLKEGNEEFDTNFHSSSSDSEQWEDLSEEGSFHEIEENEEIKDVVAPNVNQTDDSDEQERQQMVEQLGRRATAQEWLSNNVQKPWWNSKQLSERVESVFPSANLAKTWDNYCGESTSTISEYKVVREILWMLQAPTSTTLFHETGGQFKIQSNISISSLTKGSMTCYLNPLCDYFNMLHNLQKFQKEIYPMDVQNSGESHPKLPSHTFESYTSAIIEFLRELQELACDIEKKVKAQEDIYTLYSLNLELAPKLSQLRAVYSVHVTATNGWEESENWLSAARLLSVLYSEALSCMECDNPCILLRVFLKSFRPYMDMIDVWLTEGRLDDYRNEFIIVRTDQKNSETWGSDFVMREYVCELEKAGIHPLPLLQVIGDRVLHAGRSMKLLQQLDRLADMRSQHTNHGRMYAEFLQVLEKEIALMSKSRSVTTALQVAQISQELDFQRDIMADRFISDVSNQLEKLKDNCMMQAFKDYLPFTVQSSKRDLQNLSSTGEVFRRLATYSTCGLIPIKPVMERIISQLIDARHAAACFLVKTIFLQEFELSTHLALIRAIYLMEAGDIMHKFCVFIFKEADRSILWANSYALTAQLEECINLRYPDRSSKFSVVVKDDAKLSGTLSVMDEISIKYSVKWPLTIVLSPTNMEYYNSVFQFLLKVKWALWALEELRFSDLEDVSVTSKDIKDAGVHYRARCLHLLRFWLLHSVGSVHTYLMGQVLHSLGLQLENNLAAATDLDSLLHAHNEYVTVVHNHCLQPRSSDVIKTAILQMVQLSLELRDLWYQDVALISDDKIIGMTEMYIKCHCFLGSVLQTAVESNRLTHCICPMVLPSSAEYESSLFSDHMKYSLTFLAWQKDPPCGIVFPLPKYLNKYLEKGVWNKRSDTNLNAQKLEIFLDNYFLFLSRRVKSIKSKGRHLAKEVILGITDFDQSNHNIVDRKSSKFSFILTQEESLTKKIPNYSAHYSTNKTRGTLSHTISTDNSLSSTKLMNDGVKSFPMCKEYFCNKTSEKYFHGIHSNLNHTYLHKRSCCERCTNEVNGISNSKTESKKDSHKLDLHGNEKKEMNQNQAYSFRTHNSNQGIKYHKSITHNHCDNENISCNDDNLANCTKNVELCCGTRNGSSNNNNVMTHKRRERRSLELNNKVLKNIRKKCVKPNIKHSSKCGRQLYYSVDRPIRKALRCKKRTSSYVPSLYAHYNLSITQESISEIKQSHHEFPLICDIVSEEVCHNNNLVSQGSRYLSSNVNETVKHMNNKNISKDNEIIREKENELNSQTTMTSIHQNKLSANWNEKMGELTLHLHRHSLHEVKNNEDKLIYRKIQRKIKEHIHDLNKNQFSKQGSSTTKSFAELQSMIQLNKSKKFILGMNHPNLSKDEVLSIGKETTREKNSCTLKSSHSMSLASCDNSFLEDELVINNIFM